MDLTRTCTSKCRYHSSKRPLSHEHAPISFPVGVPHSIQALDEGLEILLLFTDGNFDASGTTFMLSDWLAHTPLEIVAQNFGVGVDLLGGIPQRDPYVFPSTKEPPPFGHGDEAAIDSPAGEVPNPFVFRISEQEKTEAPGGWIKIQDAATNFPVSKQLASALVFVEPNGLRELHWHINDGESRARRSCGIA